MLERKKKRNSHFQSTVGELDQDFSRQHQDERTCQQYACQISSAGKHKTWSGLTKSSSLLVLKQSYTLNHKLTKLISISPCMLLLKQKIESDKRSSTKEFYNQWCTSVDEMGVKDGHFLNPPRSLSRIIFYCKKAYNSGCYNYQHELEYQDPNN